MKRSVKKVNLRSLVGLSQAEYAEFLGISRSAVSMNESTGRMYPTVGSNIEVDLSNLVYFESKSKAKSISTSVEKYENALLLDKPEQKKLKNHILKRINTAQRQISTLKAEIENYQTNYSNDSAIVNRLKKIKFQDIPGMNAQHDLYRELMIQRINSRMKKFSAFELQRREYEIARLQAESDQGEAYLRGLEGLKD